MAHLSPAYSQRGETSFPAVPPFPTLTPSLSTAQGAEHVGQRVRVSNVRVLKNRALDSRWRDAAYPASSTPFYLFGGGGAAADRVFVDHALLKAPNAQLTAAVALDLDTALSAAQLANGLLLRAARSDAAMQPADAASTKWFAPGTKLKVSVYEDPNAAAAHGPELFATAGSARPVATGTMTIAGGAYVDFVRLNTQDFTDRATHRFVNYTSRAAHPKTKEEWRRVMHTYLHE